MDGELRSSLLKLIRVKFVGYPNVVSWAEDIVQDAYLDLRAGRHYAPDKENYGYLSVVCVRIAYRRFMSQEKAFKQVYLDAEGTSLLDETDIYRLSESFTNSFLRSKIAHSNFAAACINPHLQLVTME